WRLSRRLVVTLSSVDMQDEYFDHAAPEGSHSQPTARNSSRSLRTGSPADRSLRLLPGSILAPIQEAGCDTKQC
ncbi:hypothetical protein R5M72_21095, partial [Acinetobacter baumannii]|nr:hypothetical protein [Acinetobacter baumannii]